MRIVSSAMCRFALFNGVDINLYQMLVEQRHRCMTSKQCNTYNCTVISGGSF